MRAHDGANCQGTSGKTEQSRSPQPLDKGRLVRDPAKRIVETYSEALANAFSPKRIRVAPVVRLWGVRFVETAMIYQDQIEK